MSTVCLGTSGWHYKHWQENFYPKGIGPSRYFSFYITQFNSVELNGTYYRLPTPEAVREWYEAAPKGFAFLDNVGDHPDPAKSKFGAGPLEDRGGVDDATILRHLEPLRKARVSLPILTSTFLRPAGSAGGTYWRRSS